MTQIEYDEEDYEILTTKEFDSVSIRTIKYSTGFYAVQMYKENIFNSDKIWQTLYICPKLDKIFKMGEIREGSYHINCLLSYMEDSVKLHKNELWELKVQVPEDDFKELSEVIRSNDGKILLNELFKLTKLQQAELVNTYNSNHVLRLFEIILVIIVIGFFIWCLIGSMI